MGRGGGRHPSKHWGLQLAPIILQGDQLGGVYFEPSAYCSFQCGGGYYLLYTLLNLVG